MAAVNKINANVVEINYAEEESIKTLPTTPVWYNLQPNTVTDFGGNVAKTPRKFFTADRQRRKGQTTDLDAAGSLNHDMVQEGLQRLMQGFFFASFRCKPETGGIADAGVITEVNATNEYVRTTGSFVTDGYAVGDMIYVSGCDTAANNGLKTVKTVTALELEVDQTLVAETPSGSPKIVMCGHQFASNDLSVDASTGDLPRLVSAAYTMTDLGLVPGETIYIGGDASGTYFAGTYNGGFARVRSVTATYIELDKTEGTMTDETTSGGETVQVFMGRVIKNETGTDIVRRTYNIERKLGAPDDASPSDIQAEYITGAVPSELTVNIPTADIAKLDLSFMALDFEQNDSTTGIKTGTRVAATEEEAYNTSSNVPRIKIAIVSSTDAAPTALFAFAEEVILSINNNISADKAIGVLGGFDATHGTFDVSGNITAYFADIASVEAVRNNSDVTLELHLVRDNYGISIDVPLLALGDGRLNVEQDKSIKLPLSYDAATGASIDTGLNHTLMMVYWDYLPDVA